MAKKVSKKKKTVKKVTKKAARKATKKTTKKVAKKATKKATKKVSKSPKKTAKKPIKKTVKKVTKKATKKVVKKTESAEVIQGPTLKVGDMAPDFTLANQDGNQVSLSTFRGMNVVVYFYPKASTPGCTVQACKLRDSEANLKEAEVVVLGVSADPVKKLKQFEEKEHLNFILLSDESKKVINAYGSWGQKKFMGREFMGILRQSFLIDKNGKIIHIMHKVDTKTHNEDVLNVFKNLG